MSLRKCMLLTICALAVSGRVDGNKANRDVPKPNTLLRAPMTAVAASLWHGSQPASRSSRSLRSSSVTGRLPAALLVPIQSKNPKDLGAGKLLVASRKLRDPEFAGAVVLLVHYDEKGVLGLILNRRTDVPVSRVLDLKAAKDRSDPVYLGGPVGTSDVFALFQSPVKIKKAENIFGGVYLISDKGAFKQIISTRPAPNTFHVYVGYAGWTQDQLRAEVQLGAWFIFPADSATVFSPDPSTLWLQMIRKTEFQWAKNEPFAEILQPVESF